MEEWPLQLCSLCLFSITSYRYGLDKMANVFAKGQRGLRRLGSARGSSSTSTSPVSARSLGPTSPRPISPHAVSPRVDSGLRKTPKATLDTYASNEEMYDALLETIVGHYKTLSAAQYSGEITLLKSLKGGLDASNLPALLFLPKLPLHLQQWIKTGRASPRLSSEEHLQQVLSLFTPQQVESLATIHRPNALFRRATAVFLSLFARTDKGIEVSPGGQLVVSRAWEVWREYIKRPGQVVQTARTVVDLIKTGQIGPTEIREVQSVLKSSETDSFLLSFLRAVERFYSEWTSLHPSVHPKRPSLNLERSVERLSTSRSPVTTPSHLSSSPFQASIEKLHRQACSGLREINPNLPSPSENSPSPCKRLTAERKRVEWEVELGFRQLLVAKMKDRDGDLAGENEKTLFGEMMRTVMTAEWRKRQRIVIGDRNLEEIIDNFREKLKSVAFVKREALKAAMKVKTEGQKQARISDFSL